MSRLLKGPHTPLSFDIFCRVIDNFGDIGVCWRLARQLARPPFGQTVRLWVDDLERFQSLEKSVDPSLTRQTHAGVDIVRWSTDTPDLEPHRVVVEAFGCTPPQSFIDAMVARDSLWLNLEYLSAEPWVEGFHRQPSIQANGLRKYFFFPGFTAATGGLLREHGLIDERRRWQSSREGAATLFQRCGLPPSSIRQLRSGARLVFLFCYPDAPAATLIEALSTLPGPSHVLIPEGVHPGLKSTPFQSTDPDKPTGVQIHRIPFVDQDDFDKLLWSCDLNIVRGEDSLVRALWAGRPMIWQPYRQDDDVHLEKLDAWLARSPLHGGTHTLMRSWSQGDSALFHPLFVAHMQTAQWANWENQSLQWSEALAAQTDLASALLEFCAQQLRTG